MVYVEFVNEPYKKPESVRNLINYAAFKNQQVLYKGGVNVFLPLAVEQFMAVKQWFGKVTDCRQVRHIIIGFDPKLSISPHEADELARLFCRYYADRYQMVYGVHEDTDNLHVHIALNTVNYIDGKLYSGSDADKNNFVNYCNKVVMEYCKNL